MITNKKIVPNRGFFVYMYELLFKERETYIIPPNNIDLKSMSDDELIDLRENILPMSSVLPRLQYECSVRGNI